MSRIQTLTRIGLTVALLAGVAATAIAEEKANIIYDVTVTNLTKGQILAPPVVVAHSHRFRVFEAGEPASDELAAFAEDADSAGLIALLGTRPQVQAVSIGDDVILPGGSVTVQIEVASGLRSLTALGMLVTTNDAFFSGSARIGAGATTFDAAAYDAGSEANTEDCDHIPGPPCGNPGVRVTDGAEGFVHISSGIGDSGDLDAALFDWRNPTARISVSRAAG